MPRCPGSKQIDKTASEITAFWQIWFLGLSLPFREQTYIMTEYKQKNSDRRRCGKMKRIFFVEDDLSLINGLSFALKRQGYETHGLK